MKQGSPLPLIATILVSLSVWSAQTDNFPVAQGIRPSWYVYGWPVCFATSGRGRFNVSSFDAPSLILDLVISVVLIVCTWLAAKHLLSHLKQFSILELIAITTGFAFVFFLISGAMSSTTELLGFPMPDEQISSMAGNTRRWERFSPVAWLLFSVGFFSIGYTITTNLARLFGAYDNANAER
jgi:hypothetical protein